MRFSSVCNSSSSSRGSAVSVVCADGADGSQRPIWLTQDDWGSKPRRSTRNSHPFTSPGWHTQQIKRTPFEKSTPSKTEETHSPRTKWCAIKEKLLRQASAFVKVITSLSRAEFIVPKICMRSSKETCLWRHNYTDDPGGLMQSLKELHIIEGDIFIFLIS